MTDFSWEYVNRTAHKALVDLGRSIAETIAQAVEPGVYLVEPDTVYEVRVDGENCTAFRNGIRISGPGAEPSTDVILLVAAEMGGLRPTSIDVRTSIEMTVAI